MFLLKCFWQLFESYPFYWLYASGKLIYPRFGLQLLDFIPSWSNYSAENFLFVPFYQSTCIIDSHEICLFSIYLLNLKKLKKKLKFIY